jgi:DNA-binding Lrp family transcriptional regulator
MDELDRRIVNSLQRGFPLEERPFAAAAATLGISETALMGRLRALLERGILSRFGPLFHIERIGGRFVLAAMQVPDEALERVTAIVNAHREVAHNYERDHALNLWFVIAAESDEAVDATIEAIERESGYPVYAFPKEREYFVELMLAA